MRTNIALSVSFHFLKKYPVKAIAFEKEDDEY